MVPDIGWEIALDPKVFKISKKTISEFDHGVVERGIRIEGGARENVKHSLNVSDVEEWECRHSSHEIS